LSIASSSHTTLSILFFFTHRQSFAGVSEIMLAFSRCVPKVVAHATTTKTMLVASPRSNVPRRTYFDGHAIGEGIVVGMGLMAIGGVAVGMALHGAWGWWSSTRAVHQLIEPPPLDRVATCPHLKHVLAAQTPDVQAAHAWFFPMARIQVARVRFDTREAAQEWYASNSVKALAHVRQLMAETETVLQPPAITAATKEKAAATPSSSA
jgi:hypothetical protein